ncbi:HlyD family secretion protein [Beijerinckia indica]|uniref:Secretion protein HlyD family protein n=1 Tax=Beijerinckia indica subsp. indica (strain ATCC 9039 / DSM 1715 / NCIMB 8712) TaxID=395963 RepID=B2IFZ3_BEII9|nr:HlyD family efflux transporter periplasmic adaptor subunit [Beijerinckia indica]ACB95732.1 secretion protein HlyD family protein [Beijerinckia indica subsp. indica ATCC 9039]
MKPFSFSVTRHGIPLFAIVMIGFAGWTIASTMRPRSVTSPPIAAPTQPYEKNVSGTGIVEPASEVMALAIERGGVVTSVDVVAGDHVRFGQKLFSIDARNYQAAVDQNEAAVLAAEAAIGSIDQNILLQRDAINQARANLNVTEAERTRASLDRSRYAALVRNDWTPRQRYELATADADKADANVIAAKAALASAEQQIEVLSAQRREAEARLAQTKALLEGARADLDKTVVKAPVEGVILKVNVRLGEYALAGVLNNPLMTMGTVDPLHVRVDIDEADAWRVRSDSPATARMRGNPSIAVPLSFVRFEPYVLPKRSLSGDTSERVDTRVLQGIYAFAPQDFPAFTGQQVDVFIEAPKRDGDAQRLATYRND